MTSLTDEEKLNMHFRKAGASWLLAMAVAACGTESPGGVASNQTRDARDAAGGQSGTARTASGGTSGAGGMAGPAAAAALDASHTTSGDAARVSSDAASEQMAIVIARDGSLDAQLAQLPICPAPAKATMDFTCGDYCSCWFTYAHDKNDKSTTCNNYPGNPVKDATYGHSTSTQNVYVDVDECLSVCRIRLQHATAAEHDLAFASYRLINDYFHCPDAALCKWEELRDGRCPATSYP